MALFLVSLHIQSFGVTIPGPTSVTLSWNASPSPDIAGYRVHYGPASRSYTNIVEAGNVMSTTVSGLVSGATYYFAVTAYNALGLESVFSNETTFPSGLATVRIRLTPARQAVLTVSGVVGRTYQIQATQDLKNWATIGTVTIGAGGSTEFTDTSAGSFSQRFYRIWSTQL
jgi:fibronectin type 3 domain-containing protein